MSTRLARGGRLLDRSALLGFTFDGRPLRGFAGDTLASALLANGVALVGRSFKYHRPRGIVAAGSEEPNALVGIGVGNRHEPNARATGVELRDGLEARSQNRWPSLSYDVGAVASLIAPLLPAGFYYKTFLGSQILWTRLWEPLIRSAAGLGRPPEGPDPDAYEHLHAHVDVLVAGGGIAGLATALAAGRAGASVLLCEAQGWWGGRAPVDGARIDGLEAGAWVDRTVATLSGMPNVHLRNRTTVTGVYDHGYALAAERLGEQASAAEGGPAGALRERLWRVRAARVVVAAGAIERPIAFRGNDRPGVMLASAIRDYVVNWAVAPGDRTVVVTATDDGYRTALALRAAGLEVPAILDARPEANGALPERTRAAGLRVLTGRGIAGVVGRGRVEAVDICAQAGEGTALERVACDAVAMAGGWSPSVHLWSQPGGGVLWDEATHAFRPDPARAPTGADGAAFVIPAGAANGHLGTADVLADAHRAGLAAAAAAGSPGATLDRRGRPADDGERTGAPLATRVAGASPTAAERPKGGEPPRGADEPEAPPAHVVVMPEGASPKLRAKMWLDFQHDVKVSDIALAAREGYVSVEHAKRYTTLGMATDQGKLSNVNGLSALAEAQGLLPSAVGTTTFRPPFTPLTLGTVAGEARGTLFQPVRRTPLHAWHEARGALWEPVGQWRRPLAYPRPGETLDTATRREVETVRNTVGVLDASTLGKILVRGPDAGRFLDMLYTGRPSSLPLGRCRYGLLCNENGFLIDDGVVVRLGADSWLCHTTTGGADRIHAHMEEWRQTEWWEWQVWTQNLTEHYAQIGVAGPLAREVLEGLGGTDLSREVLPFMHWTEGEIGGVSARIFRISFSGELGFEIAVPAGWAATLWERIVAAAETAGGTVYGTEALHVLRAEKGFIMIGEETDGTVIPQDLGLGWAIAGSKADYLGKRAQARPHLAGPLRWRLVGLRTLDGTVLPTGALAVREGFNANGQRLTEGRVTSSYFSPTVGAGIALGLVERGPEREGEVLRFAGDGREVEARIVNPVFFDPEGTRLHG